VKTDTQKEGRDESQTGAGISWGLVTLIVAGLTLLAALNILGGDFVLDDHPFLVENPNLQVSHNFAWFFTENVWYYSNIPDVFSPSYRPLFFLTL
jgi:hypothetical protein